VQEGGVKRRHVVVRRLLQSVDVREHSDELPSADVPIKDSRRNAAE
jgi:hypothetical protein